MTQARPDSAALAPSAILQQALAWQPQDARTAVALATVVSVWPMAPMRAGSQMAVHADGRRCGTLFDASIDARIAQAALAAMARGEADTLQIAIDDDTASAAGLACGGAMVLRLEGIAPPAAGSADTLREALAAIEDRRSVVLCTRLADGQRVLLPAGSTSVAHAWAAEARRRARADDTGIATVADEEVLFQVFNAPLRLFVVGAVRLAQALLDAARLPGFAVTVIDPRSERMQAMSLPDATPVVDDPARALRAARLDERSAVVCLSHAAEIDDPALIEALGSGAFYIGALGSRRTHAARLSRLAERGLPAERTARIHGPAGLHIGALGPAEIAASIVAEMIGALRQGEAPATSEATATATAPITDANPTVDEMEARVARFRSLRPTDDYVDAGIPGCERTTYRVLGTPPAAPLAAEGFHLNIVYCEPGRSAPLHNHLTQEVFVALSGQWEVFWGPAGERSVRLEAWDTIAIPAGVLRGFRNVGTQAAHLMGMASGQHPGNINWPQQVRAAAALAGVKLP
ncbi:XdhC family protein [Variovorax sp. J22P168]|uniref:XdhC family protein n=1 Tax=Variovorax jilinensis TaxID=3053513 RepID=UPI002575D51A|nr:XdhC family protein [Variovorax sp. J22P168]MDM0014449.1 XdhC family protein [Variovorax sp. J22P168]